MTRQVEGICDKTVSFNNLAEVVLHAVVKPDLDTRLVEALPWVLSAYTDLNWEWLRDRAKWNNAQNRLGYLVHLAEQTARVLPERRGLPYQTYLKGLLHQALERERKAG
jgi:hypothetical protein